MFDKLIESEPAGADFKNRRGFFVVSTFVVGILFLTAVVISIYAEDFGLGSDRIELEAMLAPVDIAAAEPEPPKPHAQAAPTRDQSEVPIRREIMSRTDEPTIVPTTISAAPNTSLSRPPGEVMLGPADVNPTGSGRPESVGGPSGTGNTETLAVADPQPVKDPPPANDVPPAKQPIRSIGVANGKATYLPKPPYPAAAIAVNVQGKVNVQIMIDEYGKVVSAKAVDGHPLLRNAAEKAAWGAKFTPTLLSNVPVKVTGVIVYNFNRD